MWLAVVLKSCGKAIEQGNGCFWYLAYGLQVQLSISTNILPFAIFSMLRAKVFPNRTHGARPVDSLRRCIPPLRLRLMAIPQNHEARERQARCRGGGGGPLGLRPFSYPSHPTPVNATIRAFLQSTDPCRAGTRGFQDLCGLCLRTNHSLLGCVDGFGLVNSFERHKTSRISKASCCLAASSSGSPAGAYRSHPLDRPLQTHAGAGRRLQVGLCRKAIHDPTPGSRRSSATARQWRVCRTASTRVESFHRPRR